MYKKIICLVILSFSCYGYANTELERTIQAQGQLLTEYQQIINDLQHEVDLLRGQLEKNSYLLNQTIERQKMILQQLAGNTTTQNNPSAMKSVLADWSSSGDDKADYNVIIDFVLEGKELKNALNAFQQFLKDYPNSSYLGNVNYWLGQLCYGQERKDDASFYYATVVKDFPKSVKAGESLYKIGLLLLEKGDKVKAKAVFQQVVSQYPDDKNVVTMANSKLATLD